MKKFTIILLVAIVPLLAFSQSKAYLKAEEHFKNFEYDLAKNQYEIALGSASSQSEKAKIAYNLGYCYKMLNDPEKAELYFGVSVKNYSREAVKPDVLLYYADALRMNGKYEDAIEIYKQYIQVVPQDYRGKLGLESSEIAPKWLQRPTRYKVTGVSKFNSQHFDFSPTWATKDYRSIYFTSSREGTTGDRKNPKSGQMFTDIFEVSQDRKGAWSEPVPIPGNVNTIDDEGASCVSSKGTEMFFTRCKVGEGIDEPCKIYFTTKKGNAWGEPVHVNFKGFENSEVGYPALSVDERTIYFSAKGEKGFGGMDLYMAKRVGNSGANFEEPTNLGSKINTVGDDVYPTVRNDGTLYFSSNGHVGMGGLDIYKAIQDEKGNFIGVENLKPPINSSFDDFGIIFKGNEETGFFSSNRKGGKGSDDIYSFLLPPLTIALNGTVRDTTDINKILMVKDAKVTINTDAGVAAQLVSSDKGAFEFKLERNKNYIVRAEMDDNYFSNSTSFSTYNVEYDTAINVQINLARIKRIITLPNIVYEYDSARLKPESTVSLDDLVKTLNNNPRLKIELRSHTDYRGNDDYNMKLSLGRAKSCVDYLISKGIKADRLQAKGFGKSEPKVVDEEIAKKYNFLKVGDILTEEYIKKLNNQQQEIANQINRRTEFSILSNDYGIEVKTEDEVKKEDEQKKQPKNAGSAIIRDVNEGDF